MNNNISFLGVALFVVTLMPFSASAQDLIVLKNAQEIEAKVTAISQTDISYRKWSNLDGPIYTMSKNEIFYIKFENGEKEVISEISETSAPAVAVNNSAASVKEEEEDSDSSTLFDEIKLVNGSYEPFKRKTNAYFVIDWSNVTVVRHNKKEIGEVYGSIQDYYAKFPDKHYEDWLELQKIVYADGTVYFNKRSKGLKLSEKKEESSLIFKLNVTQLDFGNTGDYFIPTFRGKRWGGAIIDGDITITDIATGEELCRVSLIQFMGYNHFAAGDTWRLQSISLQLFERLINDAKKQK